MGPDRFERRALRIVQSANNRAIGALPNVHPARLDGVCAFQCQVIAGQLRRELKRFFWLP